MSHTPGPWAFLDRADEMTREFLVCQPVTDTDTGRYIALVDGKANARLIAAAPSMLLALKALFDAANHFHVHDKWFTDVDRNRDILLNAEAAIAKAEGRLK